MVRNAFHFGEVWNPVCCHGNKTFKFVLWSTFGRILHVILPLKHFWVFKCQIVACVGGLGLKWDFGNRRVGIKAKGDGSLVCM